MGLAARLRQAKPPARPKPVPIKMKGGRREIARARYPHPDGGDTEMVLMQDPPFYIIWRWDLQRNVFKSKDPKATIRKWAELLRKLKAKPLPQDELMKMESARFAIAALMGQPYICKGPRLVFQTKIATTERGEYVKVANHWVRIALPVHSSVVEGAGDIVIKDLDFVSDQFPDDDNDPDAAADVEVEFTIKGKALAQLLGKQARVLEQNLKKLDSKSALRLLHQGSRNRAVKDLFKALQRPVARLVNQEAQDKFDRGARLDPRSLDFVEDESYWSAKVDPKKQEIHYTVEITAYWAWT